MLILPRAAQRNGGGGPCEAWWRGLQAPPSLPRDGGYATSSEARLPSPPPSAVPLPRSAREDAAGIAARAAAALLTELETYPKPGLVSLVDSGSHDDMDAGTFRRSVAAIAPFFARLAQAGTADAPLATLRAIGLEAEAAMLAATGGVNTHRGAIFALGLLCAAAGASADDLSGYVRDTWGEALAGERPASGSHGAGAMYRFGVGGARGEAAAGFPAAVRVGLPALREGRRLAVEGPSPARGRKWPDEDGRDEAARVQAFFALLAHVDDTNLLHRGGVEGLAFAHACARGFLDAGGVGAAGWRERAVAIHRAFVARRLSPGGSADLLAVTLFLDAAERAR